MVGLPDDLLANVAPKVLASRSARVVPEAPSHLRSHPHKIMVTLAATSLQTALSSTGRTG